jgi:hypothetical protein
MMEFGNMGGDMDFDPDKVSSEELLKIVEERKKMHSEAYNIAVSTALVIIQDRIVKSLSRLPDVTDDLTKAAHRGERQYKLRFSLPIYHGCTYTLRQDIIPELKKYPDLFPDDHCFHLQKTTLFYHLTPGIEAVVKARYPDLAHSCGHELGDIIRTNEPSSLGDYSEHNTKGILNTIHIGPNEEWAKQVTLVIQFSW